MNFSKQIFTFLGIMAAIFATSCKKEAQLSNDSVFTYDGVGYSTLQEAVSAAEKAYTGSSGKMVPTEPTGTDAIKVNKNASGSGATVSDGFEGVITIDFQNYQYTLTDDCSIYIPGGRLVITGKDGCLLSQTDVPAIICEKSDVLLSGAMKVSAAILFSGFHGALTLPEEFNGHLAGGIILDSASFNVSSPEADIHITTLEMPDDAIVSVTANMGSPVVIDKCKLDVSPGLVPICADYKGAIRTGDGTDVHVHDWEIITEPATCIKGPKTWRKCRSCGLLVADIESNIKSQNDYGLCDSSSLIHHSSHEATHTDFGNIEYWECPECGKKYSDASATSLITDPVMLRPYPYDCNQNVFYCGGLFNDLFRPQSKVAVEVGLAIVTVIGTICSAVGMGTGIAGLFTGDDDYSEEFDAINEKLDVLNLRTDEMHKELEDVSDRLVLINDLLVSVNQSVSDISKTVDNIEYNTLQILNQMAQLTGDMEATQLLSTRHNALVSLRTPTESAIYSLGKHAEDFASEIAAATNYADSLKFCNSFKDNIKNLIVNIWSGTYDCAKATSELMAQYTSMSYDVSSTFPKVLETYANSHVDWENQGYSYRVSTLEEERYVLGLAFGLLQIYYCFAGDHYFMEKMLESQNAQNIRIAELTDADIENMKACYNDYRLYNPTNMKFKASLCKIDYEHLDEFVYFDTMTGFLLVDKSKEEQFHNKQGIYKDKSLSANDWEVLKSSWKKGGSSSSLMSYMCDTGIGGVEFLNGTGSFVFPFIEDSDSYNANYLDWEEVSCESKELRKCTLDRLTAQMFKKIWRSSEPEYSQSCVLNVYEYIEKSMLVSTFYPTTIYQDDIYWEFESVREEHPDNYAFNTCTLQFY